MSTFNKIKHLYRRYMPQSLRLAMPAVLLAVLVLGPFMGKAFTIDDTIFLFQSRHAIIDPLHPLAFDMAWPDVPSRVSNWPHGPLMAWLLIPTIIAGGSEWLAHAVPLLLLAVAAVATVSLALRLGFGSSSALTAGLILVAMPAVLGMAGTVMPDVPAMSLGVTGIERLLAWRDEKRWPQAVVAAILLGLAPLARSHTVLYWAVGASMLVRKAWAWRSWVEPPLSRFLPVVGALVVALVVSFISRDRSPDSGGIVKATVNFSTSAALASNIISFSVHWVLTMVFAVPWAVLRWRTLIGRWWAFLSGTAGAALLLYLAHGAWAPFILSPVAGLGIAVLIDVLADAFARRDSIQLSLGAWLLIALPTAVYVHLPPKYLVASAPAAALLLAGAFSGKGPLGRAILIVAVCTGVVLGAAILRADAVFAGVGRDAARALIAPNVVVGRRVWYLGHWGFQWYAEKAGARYLLGNGPERPGPGDLIVAAANSTASPPSLDMRRFLIWHGRISEREPGGRILSGKDWAGFYGNGWGYFPWAWGKSVVDAVDLWEICPLARSEIQMLSPPDSERGP